MKIAVLIKKVMIVSFCAVIIFYQLPFNLLSLNNASYFSSSKVVHELKKEQAYFNNAQHNKQSTLSKDFPEKTKIRFVNNKDFSIHTPCKKKFFFQAHEERSDFLLPNYIYTPVFFLPDRGPPLA
jgi:hypothetical protein